MIKSMTGFARVGARGRGSWVVEIRSLNHRYFELSLKVPPALYSLEDRIRDLCQRHLRRGKVTVNITEGTAADFEDVALDEKVLRFYLSSIRKIQKRFRLQGSLGVGEVLALPKIFSVEKKLEAPERLWASLRPPLERAVERLLDSRGKEGKVLLKDLLARVSKMEKGLNRIEGRARNLPKEYYEKLQARIRELFEKRLAENDRVWQEAVLIAERADVTEEVVRFRSHLKLFREKLVKGDEVGKELDFILQEMNREVNTMSAKAQDAGVSQEAVFVKAELEKIREQIQNIE